MAALGSSVFLSSLETGATYSVLVQDRETGEFGGAAISCVGDFDLSHIFGFVPGSPANPLAFAFFAQALYSEENYAQIKAWGGRGQKPSQILETLIRVELDPYAAERQYHFLSAEGEPLAWTGNQTLPYAGSRSGSGGQRSFTAAGNILTSERVLANLAQSFEGNVQPLEMQLLAALEAGARDGEGDSRCGELPGDSAFLTVVAADGAVQLSHSVVNTQPDNPLKRLRDAVTLEPRPQQPGDSTEVDSTEVDSTEVDSTTNARSRGSGCHVTRTSPARPDGLLLLLVGTAWILRRPSRRLP
jgi:uncharacterized Ntn-hydrolase superfamily protein